MVFYAVLSKLGGFPPKNFTSNLLCTMTTYSEKPEGSSS